MKVCGPSDVYEHVPICTDTRMVSKRELKLQHVSTLQLWAPLSVIVSHKPRLHKNRTGVRKATSLFSALLLSSSCRLLQQMYKLVASAEWRRTRNPHSLFSLCMCAVRFLHGGFINAIFIDTSVFLRQLGHSFGVECLFAFSVFPQNMKIV